MDSDVPKVKIIWGILLMAFIFIFSMKHLFGLEVFVFEITGGFICKVLLIPILILPLKFLNEKHKIVGGIYFSINLILVPIIIVVILGTIFFSRDNEYFYFHSPYNEKILVVKEESRLLMGQSEFYERKYNIFLKDLNKTITTDDGFRPFSRNAYKLQWIDKYTVKIEYDFGNGGSWHNEKIKLYKK